MQRSKSIQALINKAKKDFDALKTDYESSLQHQSISEELKVDIKNIFENLRSCLDYLAHDVAVMYLGRIVEQGSVSQVMQSARHPYTQALLSAIPEIDKTSGRAVIRLQGEMPSPIHPPSGCHFHPRCPQAMPVCAQTYPARTRITESQWVSCHLYSETDHADQLVEKTV